MRVQGFEFPTENQNEKSVLGLLDGRCLGYKFRNTSHCGLEKSVSRESHKLEVTGAEPVPASNLTVIRYRKCDFEIVLVD